MILIKEGSNAREINVSPQQLADAMRRAAQNIDPQGNAALVRDLHSMADELSPLPKRAREAKS